MRSSRGVATAAAILVSLASTALAQGGHSALEQLPLANAGCRAPVVSKQGREKKLPKGGARAVVFAQQDPPRTVTVTLDSAQRVVGFKAILNFNSPKPGVETVDITYDAAGKVKKASRTIAGGDKGHAVTTLSRDDFETVAHLTRDVVSRCRS